MTGQMQYYGQIGIIHAGTVVQVRINGDLSHGFDAHSNKKIRKMSILYKF